MIGVNKLSYSIYANKPRVGRVGLLRPDCCWDRQVLPNQPLSENSWLLGGNQFYCLVLPSLPPSFTVLYWGFCLELRPIQLKDIEIISHVRHCNHTSWHSRMIGVN